MAKWQPMADNMNHVDQFNQYNPDNNNNYLNSNISHHNHTIPTQILPNTNINNNQV